jgi:hypothetical protein
MHIPLAAGSLITAETSERRFTTGSLGSEYPFEVADGPPGSWRPKPGSGLSKLRTR